MSIVAKIGGSVLRNAESYKAVADELRDLEKGYGTVFAVVSANYGRSEELIRNVGGKDSNLLNQALQGRIALGEYDRPEVAKALIQGEWESVDMLVECLGNDAIGVKQDSVFPLSAEGSFLNGSINWEKSAQRAKKFKIAGITVIAGYGASDAQGNAVLLGRNSSDLVAAACAALFVSEELRLYKDVDGIYRDFNTPQPERIGIICREDFAAMNVQQVVDLRVLSAYKGSIRVTALGGAGTLII